MHSRKPLLPKQLTGSDLRVAKPAHYLRYYEQYFASLVEQEVNFLELGVYKGDSLELFARYFEKGLILGLDVNPVEREFSTARIKFYQGLQTDSALFERIWLENEISWLDIVIDDCSHIGSCTLESFKLLFPKLKPGGQYVIEDWMQDVLQLIGIQIKDFDSRIESAVSCNQSFCLLFEADKISYSTTEQVSVKRNKPVYETTYHSATELPYKLSLTVSCVLKEQEYDEAVSEFKKTQAELDNQFLFDLLKEHNMEDNSGADKLLSKIVAEFGIVTEFGIGQRSTIMKQFNNYIECFK